MHYDMSPEGLAELASYEGVGLKKYLDSVGVETIGLGSTKSDIPDLHSWSWDKEITIQQAFDLYKNHLQKYIDAVNDALKVPVFQHQFDAIVSICYNIGIGGMKNSTFMKKINDGSSDISVGEAIRMWNKPPEIKKRRAKEALLYTNGTYSGGGKVLVFPVINKKPRYSQGHEINALDYL